MSHTETAIPLRFEELEEAAKQHLGEVEFTYVQSGAGTEETLRANRDAFSKWKIIPRYLKNVSDVSLRTTIFGKPSAAPFCLAPVGMQGIAHPDGELASAAAANAQGIPFIASTVSSRSLEEIAAANGDGRRLFQLYFPSDMEIAASFARRAEAAGYEAIVITVDTPVVGNRERDRANEYSPLIEGHGAANYAADPVFQAHLGKKPGAVVLDEMLQYFYHPGFDWDAIQHIRDAANLPIYLKGILHPEDAKLAADYGADGIIVSNHGGRQLDGCIAALDALPAIKAQAGEQFSILFDSGIRTGPDIVKALALGADAVLIGRPYLYGLAAGGQAGVEQVIENLTHDLKTTLALSGLTNTQHIHPGLVQKI
jgi:isopentenyl diphosphate isomerase/L-lactate dehydrogenase-like FMN-dependent dehydrogenase